MAAVAEDAEIRQRLLALGGRALTDVELVGLLLDAGAAGAEARELAHEVLGCANGLGRLERSLGELALRVSPSRRIVLTAALELGRRATAAPLLPGAVFRDAAAIWMHFRGRLPQLARECFYAVLLDGRNRMQGEVRVSEGSLTTTLVHPREVFVPAMCRGAAAVVLVHNHPSGDPTPSVEDATLTERLRQVGELVGIRVLDHVVIGQGRFVSMAETGRW